ncbi:MAG: DNA primase [Robiginitomaculum sp.]|nr:MAG: DNA primase [Robiginitomaculum sp.]
MPLGKFIREISPALADEYIIDIALERKSFRKQIKLLKPETALDTLVRKKPKFMKKEGPLSRIKKISTLKETHPAKQYVVNRQIPTDKHFLLYYAPKFNSWVNSILPDKLNSNFDEPRLITPFIDSNGEMFGFAGRSFDPKAMLRYITIMIEDDMPKIFGLNTIDFAKPYFVVEGQIDSLFLSNALAMAGAEGNTTALQNVENATFVFDNENRNKEIIQRMEKVINRGNKIVIWPQKLLDNDINNMIVSGISSKEVETLLEDNTYSGLDAKLALSLWKRC